MERRFRVSPAMVVAALALVIAAFCLLYVVEQRGAIAIGSPSPNGIRVIEAGQVGGPLYEGAETSPDWFWAQKIELVHWCWWYRPEEASFSKKEYVGEYIWYHRKVTVPAGKKWMIIVSSTTAGIWTKGWQVWQAKRSQLPGGRRSGFPFYKYDIRPAGYFLWEEGGKHKQSGVLEAGEYDDVSLCVMGYRTGPDCQYLEPVVYIVLEVDA